MKKNIVDLMDSVITEITCEYCDKTIGSYGDPLDLAEEADAEGWKVTSTGKVKCPNCTKKKKRKL